MLPLYSLLTLFWNVMELCLLPDYALFSLPEPFRHRPCWKEDKWLVSIIFAENSVFFNHSYSCISLGSTSAIGQC